MIMTLIEYKPQFCFGVLLHQICQVVKHRGSVDVGQDLHRVPHIIPLDIAALVPKINSRLSAPSNEHDLWRPTMGKSIANLGLKMSQNPALVDNLIDTPCH